MTDHTEISDLRHVADELSKLAMNFGVGGFKFDHRKVEGYADSVARAADRLEAKLDMARKMVADNP